MIIHSTIRDYEVIYAESADFFGNLPSVNSFYVIDRKVYELYVSYFAPLDKDRLFLIDATEENKTIDVALQICEKMTSLSSKRNTVLVSIGGGIIQDITGFVANVLYRGIDWYFVPTTLLAACDSCIGGKTSLNFKKFKNLLGTFYPPLKIFIYPDFFETLEPRDYLSGLGEVVKFNIMAGPTGLSSIKKNIDLLLGHDKTALMHCVDNSLNFKKLFIEKDEFDRKERILLNFAHTFGHAFEVSSAYAIPHGTAVALGIVVANTISVKRSILSKEKASEIEDVIKKIVILDFNNEWFSMTSILSAIKNDKKQSSSSLTAILLDDDFSLRQVHDISEAEIEAAVTYLLKFVQK